MIRLYSLKTESIICTAQGQKVSGFDVIVSSDLENWSDPKVCFCSSDYGLNDSVNRAPEVHKYRGIYGSCRKQIPFAVE